MFLFFTYCFSSRWRLFAPDWIWFSDVHVIVYMQYSWPEILPTNNISQTLHFWYFLVWNFLCTCNYLYLVASLVDWAFAGWYPFFVAHVSLVYLFPFNLSLFYCRIIPPSFFSIFFDLSILNCLLIDIFFSSRSCKVHLNVFQFEERDPIYIWWTK